MHCQRSPLVSTFGDVVLFVANGINLCILRCVDRLSNANCLFARRFAQMQELQAKKLKSQLPPHFCSTESKTRVGGNASSDVVRGAKDAITGSGRSCYRHE